MNIGWYDSTPSEPYNAAILYWNHVVNNYSPLVKVDKDDPDLYTLEHYIFSLQEALAKFGKQGTRLFIQLPFFQVYDDPNGNEIILTDWWIPIVRHFKDDLRVAGFYMADEPEVWGTKWSSHRTPFEYEFGYVWYRLIKSIAPAKDVLCVFCDTELFSQKYGDKPAFFDIFGFDFYPFMAAFSIDSKGLGFMPDTKAERRWIRSRFREWGKIISRYGYERVVYVGQGCGNRAMDGSPNWGQRDINRHHHSFVLRCIERCIPVGLEGLLLWSWSRADRVARVEGGTCLATFAENPPKPSFLNRIEFKFRRMLWRINSLARSMWKGIGRTPSRPAAIQGYSLPSCSPRESSSRATATRR